VIRRGGLVEIVSDGETGFFWEDPAELVGRTRELAAAPEMELAAMRRRASQSAQRFSKQRFAEEVRALARELTEC